MCWNKDLVCSILVLISNLPCETSSNSCSFLSAGVFYRFAHNLHHQFIIYSIWWNNCFFFIFIFLCCDTTTMTSDLLGSIEVTGSTHFTRRFHHIFTTSSSYDRSFYHLQCCNIISYLSRLCYVLFHVWSLTTICKKSQVDCLCIIFSILEAKSPTT